jgi:hypothetical protein
MNLRDLINYVAAVAKAKESPSKEVEEKLKRSGIPIDPDRQKAVVISHYQHHYYSVTGDIVLRMRSIVFRFSQTDKFGAFFSIDPVEDLKLVFYKVKVRVNGKVVKASVDVSLAKYKDYNYGGSISVRPENEIRPNSVIELMSETAFHSESLKDKEKTLRIIKEKYGGKYGVGYVNSEDNPVLVFRGKFSAYGYNILDPMLVRVLKMGLEAEVPEEYEVVRRLRVKENSVYYNLIFPKVNTPYIVLFSLS